MIKAIIFDCFGVITADKWREFCATLPKGQVLDEAKKLNRSFNSGEISKDAFIQAVVSLTKSYPKHLDALIKGEMAKNDELFIYMAQLKHHYKLGLLSNAASSWVTESFLTEEEVELFDDVLLSFEVQMTKPNPLIYQLAAKRLGVAPEECVLVDDIEIYCQAAEAEGMTAVVYKDYQQLRAELDSLLATNSNN